MLVNKDLTKEIYDEAGAPRVYKAKNYIEEGRVNIIKTDYGDKDNFFVSSIVNGNFGDYRVNIDVKRGELEVAECECEDYQNYYSSCKHIVATLMKFEQTKFWDKDYNENENIIKLNKPNKNNYKYKNFNNLVNSFYNDELNGVNIDTSYLLPIKDQVKLETKVIYDKFTNSLKLEFKLGNKRMYKIKDLPEFYNKIASREFFKYGEKLEFVHIRENFEEKYRDLLDFILRYAEVMKYSSQIDRYNYYYTPSTNKAAITLGESTLDEAFDILKELKVNYDYDFLATKLELIEENPKVEFDLAKINDEELTLRPNVDVFKIAMFRGKQYDYLLDKNKLYRCDKDFSSAQIRILKAFRDNFTSEMMLRKEDLKDFYSIIMPKVENSVKIQGMLEDELENYIPQKLAVKLFLDFDDKNYLTADVKFCYGDEEFNPLDEMAKLYSLRNELEENKNLNIIKNTGFMLDVNNKRFILPDEEKIYEFLAYGISYYMQKFEVLVTDRFKSKEIKEPKIGAIGVRVENNLLNIDLSKLNISLEEIKNVLEKYKLKKKFYRLKDGSFLNLDENEDVEFLDKLTSGMDIDYNELKDNNIRLPANRSLYLDQLLKNLKNTRTTKNGEYKEIIENLQKDSTDENIKIPEKMESTLRDYQKIGYSWLKTLDNYKFGGILADDMGLGKTIQLLTVILSYVEQDDKNKMPSIVVSPSSLSLNWLNEAKKFAPSLKVKVISGIAAVRREQIEEIQKYDLIITSYDLLRRDVEKYKEMDYTFKYIIADEAQYLKNSNTQNARAIKSLKGETRFALTGTPIENSLAELWSIFDFIMPGYLFQYRKFKATFEMPIVKEEDKAATDKLKMLIAPFILRRTKKEVLTELPDKTITVLNNTMDEEQEKVYMSYLAKAKQEVAEKINVNGFEKSQIMILAALTRLRQICCHPGLFLSDYEGSSSKLSQCMEIIEDAVRSGHKILLFSGYTSMFDIIQKELIEKDIKFFKLIGSTKVDERIRLVDEFNSNPEIKVFLISLKAGGTGLNLTGADMVIHYDPWWNSSSENQATDRAYRIGQKNNVQVYKLITTNSIEEKIYELQQKKTALIDNMLSTKTSFISKFTKEEIMSLFE